jgi:protein tyrosine phosphatase (PTP) superfamily phosphohydrolase (DUF442 family)
LQEEGVKYVCIPWQELKPNENDLVDQVIKHIKTLPQPVFVHCCTGFNSAFIALLSSARQNGGGAKQVLDQGLGYGLDFKPYERFMKYYLYHSQRRITFSS